MWKKEKIIFILLTYSSVKCDDLLWDKTVPDDRHRQNEGTPRMSEGRKWITELFDKAKFQFSLDANVTNGCRKDFQLYKRHLTNQSIWAVRMLESSEWPTTSVLAGNVVFMGNWFECRLISAYGINGQFCFANATYDYDVKEDYKNVEWPSQESSAWNAVKMYRKDPTRLNRQELKWGLCIPSSCTSQDLEISLNNELKPTFKKQGINIQVVVSPVMCSKRDEKPYPKQYYYFWYTFAGYFAFVVSCTVYDMKYGEDAERSLYRKLLSSYSLVKNCKNLIKPSPVVQRTAHLMKAVATIFALYAHQGYFYFGFPKYNADVIELRYKSLPFDLAHSALTDIFLLVSGYLAFDFGIKEVSKGGAYYLLLSFLTRWLRMCIPFGIVIYLIIYVIPFSSDGPLWNYYTLKEAANCQENWWTSILALANIVNVERQCTIISWFISVDLHLTIIASFLMYTIYRNHKIGAILTVIVFFAGMIFTFMVVYVRRLNGVFMFYMSALEDPRKIEDFNYQYIATYARISPYFTGFITAIIAHILKKKEYQFSRPTMRATFLPSVAVTELYQMYSFVFYGYGREYNAFENAIYAATHRWIFVAPYAWGLCTFATSDPDKIFASLVKSKVAIIMGRLSYSTFLLNTVILTIVYSLQASLMPTSNDTNLYWLTAALILMSYVIGFFFHIFIEAPIFNVVKILMTILARPKKKSKAADDGIIRTDKDIEEFTNESFVPSNGNRRIFDLNSSTNIVVAIGDENYKF